MVACYERKVVFALAGSHKVEKASGGKCNQARVLGSNVQNDLTSLRLSASSPPHESDIERQLGAFREQGECLYSCRPQKRQFSPGISVNNRDLRFHAAPAECACKKPIGEHTFPHRPFRSRTSNRMGFRHR